MKDTIQPSLTKKFKDLVTQLNLHITTVIRFQLEDTGTVTMIKDTDKINIATFIIQKRDNITQITTGIGIVDGASKNHQIKLLHLMIQILTSKDHIMTTMMSVVHLTTGKE